jgi:transposase
MKQVSVLGIDLAKQTFSVCGMSSSGKVIFRKSLTRQKLIEFTAQFPKTMIAFEACGGSHYWGRVFLRQGHQVKMLPIYKVKAYTPPQKKNDASDAEAICLAALSENNKSVRIKDVSSQNIDVLLNLREQFVKQRVALINQVHAIALEYGVALPKAKTPTSMEKFFEALEDASNELTDVARKVIFRLIEKSKNLDEEAEKVEKELSMLLKGNENFERLKTVPGVGLMIAASILAHTGGDVSSFKNGRHFSAFLGLVPRQYSTGGRTKLLGITRCGNGDIRKRIVSGTNSVMRLAHKKEDRVSKWIMKIRGARGYKKASIALANKTARICFAVLKTQSSYVIAA